MKSKFSPREVRALHEEYLLGRTLAEVGERHGISGIGLSQMFRRNGLSTRAPGHQAWARTRGEVALLHAKYLERIREAGPGRGPPLRPNGRSRLDPKRSGPGPLGYVANQAKINISTLEHLFELHGFPFAPETGFTTHMRRAHTDETGDPYPRLAPHVCAYCGRELEEGALVEWLDGSVFHAPDARGECPPGDPRWGPVPERPLPDCALLAARDPMDVLVGEGQAPGSEAVRQALDELPDRDRRVLEMRYGLQGRELKLREVGRVFGITRERARQVEEKALARLRELLDVPEPTGLPERPGTILAREVRRLGPEFTRREAMDASGLDPESARAAFSSLRERGLIERVNDPAEIRGVYRLRSDPATAVVGMEEADQALEDAFQASIAAVRGAG